MDRNTILGMVLMGLVLFGFLYCNRGEKGNNNGQTATTEAQVDSRTVDSMTIADTYTPAFESSLADIVRQYGVHDGNGKYILKTTDGELTTATTDTATLGKIDGTLLINDHDYNLQAVFNNADTTVMPNERAAAATVLTKIRNTYLDYGKFTRLLNRESDKPFTLKNNKIAVTFNPRGGIMEKVQLLEYSNENPEDKAKDSLVNVVNRHSPYSFSINMSDHSISTEDMVFTPAINGAKEISPESYEVSTEGSTVTMTLNIDSDQWMKFTYTLLPDQYIVRLDVTQHNMAGSDLIPANVTDMGFNWSMLMNRNEVGRTFEERNSQVMYKLRDESPDDLSAHAFARENIKGDVKWVAFKNQFFSAVVIPRGYFSSAEMTSAIIDRNSIGGQVYVKKMTLDARFAYSPKKDDVFSCDFYLGPNSYSGLADVDDILYPNGNEDLELQKLVPLGWGIFGWINRFVVIPLFNFLGSFIGSYGLIILLLTIIIKIILFPFTYKSYMSQAKMRVLAPEIKEINEKYPGQENAVKRQQETMKLYNRAGASPFSGCLPMLLQLPVLIALFSFFPSAIELRGQSFLWAHDLAAPDYICTLPFTIPFYGNKVSLFCLLMTVTNIVYTRISMASNPSAGMGGMKWMTYLMPIMFLFFFNDYASGLSYYYFISLLITITQTYICRLIVDEGKVRQQMLDNANKPRKKKGFMARLEAAQKKQEAMMREQAKQRAKRNR